MSDNFITTIIRDKLNQTKLALEYENKVVDTNIREAKQSGVQPAKDYWHKQDKLRNMVKTLEKLLEDVK